MLTFPYTSLFTLSVKQYLERRSICIRGCCAGVGSLEGPTLRCVKVSHVTHAHRNRHTELLEALFLAPWSDTGMRMLMWFARTIS